MKKNCFFKIAIIGAGSMAKEHIRVFKDIHGVQVEGIFSRTLQKAQNLANEFSIPIVASSIEELYKVTRADLVVVAVSVLETRNVAEKVFEFPWVSLIEKPVGINYEESKKLSNLSKKKNAKSFVALNRRHLQTTRAILSELEFSKSPRIIKVYDQETPEIEIEDGVDEIVVKNWMYGNSIHVVDFFQIFARGKVTNINNIVRLNSDNNNFCISELRFSSGDIGIYEAFWDAPAPWAVTVTTKDRRWEMRPLEKAFSQNYRSRALEPLKLKNTDKSFKPGLRLQAEEAIKVLRNEPSKLPSLGDALKTTEIIKGIYEI